MVRLVLFDIDGTLIESGGAGMQAFACACAMEFKVPNGAERLRFAGRTDRAIVREFFLRHQIEPSPANFERFFECYVFWLDHLLEKCQGRVLPGVKELLDGFARLAQRPMLGLLTGNIRLGAQIKLTHFQLWHHFRTGGFGDDHEDRDQIAAIARGRGSSLLNEDLSGDQILVIGDTHLDVQCGKAIGAKVLAVATGSYALHQLRACAPDWVVSDLRQVNVEHLCGNSELKV